MTYRRQDPPKAGKPRGMVVTLPDDPDDLDAAEKKLREARFRAQRERVEAELRSGRMRTALTMRAAGGVLFLVAIFLASRHPHGRGALLAGVGLLAGPFLVIFGAGGSATPQSTPVWWRMAVIFLTIVGSILGLGGRLF